MRMSETATPTTAEPTEAPRAEQPTEPYPTPEPAPGPEPEPTTEVAADVAPAEERAKVPEPAADKLAGLSDEERADIAAPGTVTATSNDPETRVDGIQNARPQTTPQTWESPTDIMSLVLNGYVEEGDAKNPQRGDQVLSLHPRVIIASGPSLQKYWDERNDPPKARAG